MTHVPDTQNWQRPPFVSGTSGPVIQSVVSRYDVRTHSQPKSASMELPETGKFSYERASLPSGLAYDRYLFLSCASHRAEQYDTDMLPLVKP